MTSNTQKVAEYLVDFDRRRGTRKAFPQEADSLLLFLSSIGFVQLVKTEPKVIYAEPLVRLADGYYRVISLLPEEKNRVKPPRPS